MELQFLSGEPDAVTEYGRQALELFQALNDHWGISAVQYHHGLALHRAGRLQAALAVHEAALAHGRRGLTNMVPYVLADLAHITLELGDPDRVAQHFTEAHFVARQLGGDGSAAAAPGEGHLARDRGDLGTAARRYDQSRRWLIGQATPEWAAAALNGLGFTAALRANLDDAAAYHRSAWQVAAHSPAAGARAAATALEGLAGVAAIRGDGSRAAELLGTAARWRQWRHQPPLRREQHDIDRATAHARDLFGEPAYRQAYTRGLQPPPGAVVDPEQPVEPQLAAWLRQPVPST